MPLVQNLQIGLNSYSIQDEKATELLTSSDRTILLSNGTYRGEKIASGATFIANDGTAQVFSDTIGDISIQGTEYNSGYLSVPTGRTQMIDGKFCVPVQYGNIYVFDPVTKTGTNWSTGSSGYMKCVHKALNKYIAYGDGAKMCTADDPTGTWTVTTLSTSWNRGIDKFVSGNGVVIGYNSDGNYYYSTDGETWTMASGASGSHACLQILYGKGKFVSIHREAAVSISTDGVHWTEYTTPFTEWHYDYSAALFDGERFVLCMPTKGSYTSTDGITWTKVDTTENPEYFEGGFCYNQGAYVGSRALYGDQKVYVYYSTDLLSWTRLTVYNGYDGLSGVLGEGGYYYCANQRTSKVKEFTIEAEHIYSLTPLTYSKAQVDTALASKASTDTFTTTTAGLVPAPTASSTSKFLRGDGTWANAGGGGGGTEYVEGENIVFEDASVGKYVLKNATEDLVNHTVTLNGTYAGATIPSLSLVNISTLETFKFQVKCKLAGTTNVGRILQAFGTTTSINKRGVCYIGNTNVGSLNLTDSNTYYFSIDKDDENLVTIKYSSDGTTWTTVGSKTMSSGMGVWTLGGPDVSGTEAGMIFYMDECFIEFDGVKVWQGYDSSKLGITRIDTAPSVAIDYAKDASSVIIGKNQLPSTLLNAVVIGKGASASSAGVAVGLNCKTSNGSVAIGADANGNATGSTLVGYSASVTGARGMSLGREAKCTAEDAVQIGAGTNEAASTLQFRGFPLVDANGQVVHDRLSTVVKTFATTPSTGTVDRADFLGQLGYSTSLQKLYWAKSASSTSGHLLNMNNYNDVTISDDFVASGFLSGTITHYLYKNFTSTSSISSSALYFKLTIPSTVTSTMYFAGLTTTGTTYNGSVNSSGYISLGSSYTMAQNYKGHTVWFVYTGNNSASTSDLYTLIDDNNTYPTIEDLPAFTSSAWTTNHVSYVLPLGSITQLRLGSSPSSGYAYNFAGSIDLKGVRLVRNDVTDFDAAPVIYGTNWQEVGAGGGFDPESITGYDATKVQTLKNNKGSLLWYDEDFLKTVDSLPAQGEPDTMYFVTGES